MIDDRRPHVMPDDESAKHVFNMTCPCKPKLVDGGKVVVHFGFTVKRRQWKVNHMYIGDPSCCDECKSKAAGR